MMAWKWLGTQERVDKITEFMAGPNAPKLNDTERKNVEVFENVVYKHMIEGRKAWLGKEPQLR